MVVTREPEFDDAERGAWLRLQEYEDSIDQQTGLPAHEAYDEKQTFDATGYINHAAKAQAAERRRLQKEAEQKSAGKTAPEGWDDGLNVIVRKLPTEIRKDPSAH